MIDLLIEKGADVNKRSSGIDSYPLIEVLKGDSQNRYKLAWKLIEHGAICNDGDLVFFTVLTRKEEGIDIQIESVDLLDYFIEQGIDINPSVNNTWYKYQNTLIENTVYYNNVKATLYLIDKGYYSVDEKNIEDGGYTLLTYTVFLIRTEICQELLKRKVNIFQKDSNGKLAIDYAIENNNQDIINMLSNGYF